MITSLGALQRPCRRSPAQEGRITRSGCLQHLGQVVAHRDVELVVRAAEGLAVRPPAQELPGVTKTTSFELVAPSSAANVEDVDVEVSLVHDNASQVRVPRSARTRGAPRR